MLFGKIVKEESYSNGRIVARREYNEESVAVSTPTDAFAIWTDAVDLIESGDTSEVHLILHADKNYPRLKRVVRRVEVETGESHE